MRKIMAREISMREQSRIDQFKKLFRGVPTHVVGQVLSWNSPGIDWRDSNKDDMARGWAREDSGSYYVQRGSDFTHPDLQKVHKECMEYIARLEAAKKRSAQMAEESKQRAAAAFIKKTKDDEFLRTTFKSHRTGIETTWIVSKYLRDASGEDVQGWELSPSMKTIMDQPQLDGWKIVIFND